MKNLLKTSFIMVVMAGLLFSASAHAMMSGGGSTGMLGGGGTMGGFMQMPTAQQMFEYGPVTAPVAGTDVSNTMPIGVGPVAMGGNTITAHVAVGQFSGPMDMYLTVYAPAVDPFNIYLMHPDGTLHPVSAGFEPWMTGVTAVDQTPITGMPTSSLAKGTYTVGLMATPTGGNLSTYYMWTTHFDVQ